MKTITVQIIEKREPNTFSYGGYEVKLTCGSKAVEAFINFNNIVTSDFWLHGLIDNAPHKSERKKQVLEAIQEAFTNWNETQKEVQVNI